MQVLYTANATATGGRDGRGVSSDKALDVALSTPKELGGAGGEGTNPEQLFAAGYAACFLSAMKLVGGATSGRIDPTSYARWDGPVRALLDINATDAAQVYVNVKPLFDEAYGELGYPGGNFDEAIVRAIKMLVETPEAPAELVLVERPAYFDHDDPALRSLRPVQKQLLLTGPEHRRQVITWLRRFAATLALKID